MNGYQLGKPYYRLTAPHLQYAHHAPMSPKHTVISSDGPISTAQQITMECLALIRQINLKWQLPAHLTVNILLQLRAWASNEQSPLIIEAATNQTHLAALHSQARIGWGWFFKGFCEDNGDGSRGSSGSGK
jgi:hypothetical protein